MKDKDDEEDKEVLALCDELEAEVRRQSGQANFRIVNRARLYMGERMDAEQHLDSAALLLPLLQPLYFTDKRCRRDLEGFLKREAALRRDDLILPIYYIECEELQPNTTDELGREIAKRKPVTWDRFADKRSRRSNVADLARQLVQAMRRASRPAAPALASVQEPTTDVLVAVDRSKPEHEPTPTQTAAEEPPESTKRWILPGVFIGLAAVSAIAAWVGHKSTMDLLEGLGTRGRSLSYSLGVLTWAATAAVCLLRPPLFAVLLAVLAAASMFWLTILGTDLLAITTNAAPAYRIGSYQDLGNLHLLWPITLIGGAALYLCLRRLRAPRRLTLGRG